MTAGRRELSGTVTAITYPGLGSSPVLRMSMRTEDGTVTLAFLGRRGAAILYNPDYTVTPRGKDDG